MSSRTTTFGGLGQEAKGPRDDERSLPVLDEEGRTSLEGREQIYEDIDRRFAEEVHNIWLWYTPWTIATAPDMHDVPGEGPTSAEGFPGLASGHPVADM
jgi:hypothetical protein